MTEESADIGERVHQQLIYKDNRIIDLNNVILDKERQILDLQERVREQGEVANVKTQAMRIVQQKFGELQKERKDMSTETDSSLLNTSTPSTSYSSSPSKPDRLRARSSSPGHAIASRRSHGTFSPPPIDPPTAENTSKFGNELPDVDGINHSKKYRKRVTFDLPPRNGSTDELTSALTEASSQNSLLRKEIEELNRAVEEMKKQYEEEIAKYSKEAKTAGLKARVVATARIKELETSLELLNEQYITENERLKEEVNTLRNTRDWEVEQNGQLRDQILHLKEKSHKLTEELDESEKNKRKLDVEVAELNELRDLMVDDLAQAENIIKYHETQKEAIFDDVDKLKEAITAQDRFIEILEADIVIYEQHIGLLRESLGASKIDHRALIKSKAFETKLLALEKEKELIDKKSNEDRLKTKALDNKCRVLVEQNEKLMERLCEFEMNNSEDLKKKNEELTETVRQLSAALEGERDISEKLREAKENVESELSLRKSESCSSQVQEGLEDKEDYQKMVELLEEMQLKYDETLGELEDLRAANFDLQMNVEEANKNMEDAENRIGDLEDILEMREEDLKQSNFNCDQLSRQLDSMRVEINSARAGLQEARAVEKEVQELKHELLRQQDNRRKEYEENCRKIAEEEADTGNSRKSSLEIQYEQYILAYEKKIEKLEQDLKESNETNEKDKAEKKKLKLAIKQLRDRETPAVQNDNQEELEKLRSELAIVKGQQAREIAELQKLTAERDVQIRQLQLEKSQKVELPVQTCADNSEIKELSKKLEEIAMEAKLSGELNIELGRAMQELEEENDLLRAEKENGNENVNEQNKMELRLHEMLVDEMSAQIEDLQSKLEEKETIQQELTISQQQVVNHQQEIDRLLHNLAEFEIARKDEMEALKQEHKKELERIVEEPIQQQQQNTMLEQQSQPSSDNLVEENCLLRECINETSRVHDDVSRDMTRLIELKDELEIAVQALKAEIWSINGQLKESILDRETLENKVAELDTAVEKEKKRAISLDVELQEQIDLTDRALRRAAEAENDSNRRLAECLEMEERREEIEKAYASLNEYYNQLQTAYNELYAQVATGGNTENLVNLTASTSTSSPDLNALIDNLFLTLSLIQSVETEGSYEKLRAIVEKVKRIVVELEETKNALEEQRRIRQALEDRLENAENGGNVGGEDGRIEQLEGEIEWKEEECEGLKRRIGELERALDNISKKAGETEAATVSRLSTELAILAAKLTTRQADVDSLFRTNAELAHTNVGLQNEVDELEELRQQFETEKSQLLAQIKQLEQQVEELELKLSSPKTEDNLEGKNSEIEKLKEELEKCKNELEEAERLKNVEKILNNRILALEDQNLELEEKLQEIEEEMTEVRQNVVDPSEIQRLKTIESELLAKIEELGKEKPKNEEENWGWNEEEPKTSNSQEQNELRAQILNLEKHAAGEREAFEEEIEFLKSEKEQLIENIMDLNKKIGEMKEGEKGNEEIERLKNVEMELLQKISVLEEGTSSSKDQADDNWGWDDEVKISETPETVSQDKMELLEEIERLKNVESALLEKIEAKNVEKDENWGWEEEERNEEVERLKEVEKELLSKIDELERSRIVAVEKSEELAERIVELEKPTTSTSNDENWGWDEENHNQDQEMERLKLVEKELLVKIDELERSRICAIEKSEELAARILDMEKPAEENWGWEEEKSQEIQNEEVERLKSVEAELLAKIDELERSRTVAVEKSAQRILELEKPKTSTDENWGWDEEKPEISENEEIERLKLVETDLLVRISEVTEKFTSSESRIQQLETSQHEMKELLRSAEQALVEEQDRNDKLLNNTSEMESKLKELQENETALKLKISELQESLDGEVEEKNLIQVELDEILEEMSRLRTEMENSTEEKEEGKGWDDDGWGNEETEEAQSPKTNSEQELEEVQKQLEIEIKKREDIITRLGEELSAVQDELLKIDGGSSDEMEQLRNEIETKNCELENVRKELRMVSEQNELLKDSEARLIDHADEFAEQMERYKSKCSQLTDKIRELESQLTQHEENQKATKKSSDELVTLRQQLQILENELRQKNNIISDREGLINELQQKLNNQNSMIESLNEKLKSYARRSTAAKSKHPTTTTSSSSRPSSRMSTMSTSSKLSHHDSISENPNQIQQSSASAFDVVVPQTSMEPLRRRTNK